MNVRIIPSIASANQVKIFEEMQRVSGFEHLHIDIEDGNFVPNITFGMKTVKKIIENSTQKIDVHLLVTNPMFYIRQLDFPQINAITVHYESLEYPLQALNAIHKMRKRAGLALNFKTLAEDAVPFADLFDHIIVMTAEPDEDGENFYPGMMKKISDLRRILSPETEIWADGGINESTINSVLKAGADTVIMGRAVFNEPDPIQAFIRAGLM